MGSHDAVKNVGNGDVKVPYKPKDDAPKAKAYEAPKILEFKKPENIQVPYKAPDAAPKSASETIAYLNARSTTKPEEYQNKSYTELKAAADNAGAKPEEGLGMKILKGVGTVLLSPLMLLTSCSADEYELDVKQETNVKAHPIYVPGETIIQTDTIVEKVPEYIHDTTYVKVPEYVHDTTYVKVPEYIEKTDTIYKEVPVIKHDTIYQEVPVIKHDTIYQEVPVIKHDTITVPGETIYVKEKYNPEVNEELKDILEDLEIPTGDGLIISGNAISEWDYNSFVRNRLDGQTSSNAEMVFNTTFTKKDKETEKYEFGRNETYGRMRFSKLASGQVLMKLEETRVQGQKPTNEADYKPMEEIVLTRSAAKEVIRELLNGDASRDGDGKLTKGDKANSIFKVLSGGGKYRYSDISIQMGEMDK